MIVIVINESTNQSNESRQRNHHQIHQSRNFDDRSNQKNCVHGEGFRQGHTNRNV